MSNRNDVVVLSSDDEDGSNTRSLSSSRAKPKPRSRSRSSSSGSRGRKRARVSSSGNHLSKVYEINLFDDDFNEVFTGSKVFAGTQRSNGEELWVDKYKPHSLEELAVHKKKVEELKTWFEERLKPSKENSMSFHDDIMDFTVPENVEELDVDTTPVATGATLPPLPKPSKRKARSDVWDHFKKEPGEEWYAKCNYCEDLIKYKSGTSSMRNHLARRKESPINTSNKRQRQATSNATEGQVASSPSYSKFDQAACRVQLAKTIVSAELPFRFVENEDFQKFLNMMQPRFDIPSRSTVRRDIWKLYIEEKLKLKAILSKHCGRVCLTTDTWTSAQNLTYMSLTAHYVDCEWKLQKKIINFCQITGHSGADIAMHIEDFLNGWELKRVLTITVDNASANDAGLKYLKSRMESWDNLVLNGDYIHMRCCAHILNLIVKEGLKEVDKSILRIRVAVKYVNASPAREKKFRACAEEERITEKSALILDVDTRWNSTFFMLRSAIKYQNAFSLLQLRDKAFKDEMQKKNMGLLEKEDWDHAKSVVPFLEMFMVSTKSMSGTSYVTSNLYMKEIFGIGAKIQKHLDSSNERLKNMAKGMKSKFNKYWGDLGSTNILLWIAVVLDPRMKYSFVEYHIGVLCDDASKATAFKLKVMTSLKSLYDQYQGIEQSSQPDTQPDDDDDDPMYLYLKKTGRRADPQSEIDKYLKEAAEPYNKHISFDILGWWKVNSSRFPILASIAREVLAIPVSTVASECAFSAGGRVLGDHRCCLTHTMVEGLVCLQDWLKGQPHYLFNDEDPEEILRFDQEICSQDRGVNLDD